MYDEWVRVEKTSVIANYSKDRMKSRTSIRTHISSTGLEVVESGYLLTRKYIVLSRGVVQSISAILLPL